MGSADHIAYEVIITAKTSKGRNILKGGNRERMLEDVAGQLGAELFFAPKGPQSRTRSEITVVFEAVDPERARPVVEAIQKGGDFWADLEESSV